MKDLLLSIIEDDLISLRDDIDKESEKLDFVTASDQIQNYGLITGRLNLIIAKLSNE